MTALPTSTGIFLVASTLPDRKSNSLRFVVLCTALAAFLPELATAQFHVKEGDKVVHRSQIPTASSAAAPQGGGNYQGTVSNAAAVAATTQSDSRAPSSQDVDAREYRTTEADGNGIADRAWKLKISRQQAGQAEIVYGQAKHHPNGNYTIEKVIDGALIQRTFSPPRTAEEHQKTDDERLPIERRVVQLNAMGRPLEVLIYDIRNQLKFRGVLVYDPRSGRFMEEQLLTPDGRIVRRKVQTYDGAGQPMPLKTFMDADNIGTDVALVLTGQESPTGFSGAGASEISDSEAGKKEDKSILRRMMFWK